MDIGANIGAIALGMSYYAKNGRVYAFETSAVNFHYMSYNVQMNGASVVEPVKLGVFDRNAEKQFLVHRFRRRLVPADDGACGKELPGSGTFVSTIGCKREGSTGLT